MRLVGVFALTWDQPPGAVLAKCGFGASTARLSGVELAFNVTVDGDRDDPAPIWHWGGLCGFGTRSLIEIGGPASTWPPAQPPRTRHLAERILSRVPAHSDPTPPLQLGWAGTRAGTSRATGDLVTGRG